MDFGIIAASSTQLVAQAISLVQGLWLVLVLAIGLPLGFWLGKKIIGLFPKK